MEQITNFITKTKGSKNISCIITNPSKVGDVESILQENNSILINNKVDFYTLSEQGKTFFIPVYKLDNLEEWYKIAFDYASGQLFDYEMDRRINPDYENNNIIYVIYDIDAVVGEKNLLEVVGLTLQVK